MYRLFGRVISTMQKWCDNFYRRRRHIVCGISGRPISVR